MIKKWTQDMVGDTVVRDDTGDVYRIDYIGDTTVNLYNLNNLIGGKCCMRWASENFSHPVPDVPGSCDNCKFGDIVGDAYGGCMRYPQYLALGAKFKDHWCGEYVKKN